MKLQKIDRRMFIACLCIGWCLLALAACYGQQSTEKITDRNTQAASAETETDISEVTTVPAMESVTSASDTMQQEEPVTIIFQDSIQEDTAVSPEEMMTQPHYLYVNDFSEPIVSSDPDWFVNESADISDGNLTSTGKTHFYLASRHKMKSSEVSVTLDLQAKRPGCAAHDSGYIGLRVQDYDNQFAAVGNSGIWLAFQNKSIGVINTWPNVSLFQTDWDFSTVRRVYIEDNTETGEIKVFTDSDDNTRSLVFRVIIQNGRNVSLINAEGRAILSTTFNYDIDNTGHVCFWAHQNDGGVVYDNISIAWTESVHIPYVEANRAGIRDLYSDTWKATDGAGRTLTVGDAVIKDKLVGIFYEVWHTAAHATYADQKLYDHNAIYREGGVSALIQAIASGPVGWPHYWAEPYFGYYLSTDHWVIRKHASMLSDIGIDFIYLDVTNGQPYTNVYKTLFREFRALREEGVDTPDICFFLSDNAANNEKVFADLWDNIYSTGEYRDIYAMYKGKPLILGNLSNVDAEKQKMFTIRRCWALQENLGNGKDYWNWMCETPQVASYNSKTGEIEEMSISAGILANLSIGRSYTAKGRQPVLGKCPDGSRDDFQFYLDSTPYGLLFAEQMKRAQDVDPYVLLVTGWNEWTAGRWETEGSGALIANTYLTGGKESWTKSYYVDCFNPEFSRDIEPMRGGFGDNYYYQLAAFLRIFKGSRNTPPADGQVTIDINDSMDQWRSVWPEFRDTSGDTVHRDSLGFIGSRHYTNTTGRNDIINVKVSRSGTKIWFMAECKDEITQPDGTEWMNLFIDSDCNSATGWEGYDFVIGRDVSGIRNGKGKVSIHAFVNHSWEMVQAGLADVRVEGRYIVFEISTDICNLNGDFDFKWADNSVSDGDIMAFLDKGDAAPNGRFKYAYCTATGKATFSKELERCLYKGAGFVAEKPYMAVSEKVYTVCPSSTAVVPHITHNRIFVPVSALEHVDGFIITLSENGLSATVTHGQINLTFTSASKTVAMGVHTVIIPVAPYMENGQLYVPLNVVAYYNGLNLLTDNYGRALMTSADIASLSDEDIGKILNELDKSV